MNRTALALPSVDWLFEMDPTGNRIQQFGVFSRRATDLVVLSEQLQALLQRLNAQCQLWQRHLRLDWQTLKTPSVAKLSIKQRLSWLTAWHELEQALHVPNEPMLALESLIAQMPHHQRALEYDITELSRWLAHGQQLLGDTHTLPADRVQRFERRLQSLHAQVLAWRMDAEHLQLVLGQAQDTLAFHQHLKAVQIPLWRQSLTLASVRMREVIGETLVTQVVAHHAQQLDHQRLQVARLLSDHQAVSRWQHMMHQFSRGKRLQWQYRLDQLQRSEQEVERTSQRFLAECQQPDWLVTQTYPLICQCAKQRRRNIWVAVFTSILALTVLAAVWFQGAGL